jgi:ABC-type amino acid transport substrate-binding protein
VAITPEKASRLGMTRPYLQASLALIVPDFERRRFASAAKLREEPDLTLAVPPSSYFADIIQGMFPNARLVSTPSPRPYLKGEIPEADALVSGAESGSAWTMVYPDYTVVVPEGISFRTPVAFAIPLGDAGMKAFLDAWLDLKESNGVLDRFYRHWILGEDAVVREPRWSVIKDVLHLVE